MTNDKATKKQEKPRDIRKKNKRLEVSRDDLKRKNKQKALEIKRLGGKIDDINESRDKWRQRYEAETSKAHELGAQLKDVEAKLNAERQLAQQLRIEIETFQKKART